ncbi:MAG: hypothetical protein CL764_04610 [Chloroflexi bacterium]|nr:hypothetical protein [Chloroflexota bacterium]|tara:strand:+ start:604 stop:1404 length:801 start_codon:yes stop_codon:yes gene_type:complete
MNIDRRTAVVTGGATGIGESITMKFCSEGYNVIVADLNKKRGKQISQTSSKQSGNIIFCETDVTEQKSIKHLLDFSISNFENINILINNAGVAGAKGWENESVSREEDWKASWEVNILGLINVTNEFLPELQKNSGSRIVNIASVSGRQGRPSLPHYSSTKAAVINFTKSLHKRLENSDISVNAVCPGLIWTPMWEQVGLRYSNTQEKYKGFEAREVFDDMVKENIPLRRETSLQDVANLVFFLVSLDSSSFSGQAINVDGGFFLN